MDMFNRIDKKILEYKEETEELNLERKRVEKEISHLEGRLTGLYANKKKLHKNYFKLWEKTDNEIKFHGKIESDPVYKIINGKMANKGLKLIYNLFDGERGTDLGKKVLNYCNRINDKIKSRKLSREEYLFIKNSTKKGILKRIKKDKNISKKIPLRQISLFEEYSNKLKKYKK